MADVVLRVCWKKNTKEELMEVLTGVKEIVASSNSPQNKSLRKTKFETKLNFKAKFKLQGEPGFSGNQKKSEVQNSVKFH